jgi:putative ABC transport system permease protein
MYTVTNLMYVLLALVGLIVLYFVWLFVRKPVLIKLGLRNIPRRPTQTALIVVGLTLSTIIFLSSFAIGDTLNYSVQQQAINAYGAIDEVLAPPIFSLLVGLDDQALGEDETISELESDFTQLTEGGLSTVLAIVQGGLPSISEERFRLLKEQAVDEPLIDGVAGSILFPTIIRNVSSGQGEPLGFIFAVDDEYGEQFGLVTVDGEAVAMDSLEPGVGNIFGRTADLFGLVGDFGAQLGLDESALSGAAALTAAVGAAVTLGSEGGFDPAAIEIDVGTIRSLGVDTTALDEAGIETLSLEALGITPENLEAMGVPTGTLSIDSLPVDDLNILGVNAADVASVTTNLLGALNLNTLGRELDSALGSVGLQLRQGDVYLNRLGAERLNARVGDVLEIYIGPIPVPFRVKAIVEQAGPTAALTPVVMMRLSEAQQLLFMRGQVNNILVSNLGDERSGIEHTSEVSNRLRVLAMDEAGVEEVVEILRRPDVRAIIDAEAPKIVDTVAEDFDNPPPIVASLVEDLTNTGELIALVSALPAELDQPGISDGLRQALGNNQAREWLVGLDLPSETNRELKQSIRSLNEFDLIDPLNKSTVVTVAGLGGTAFTSIFSLFGFFSILAGILLIFLIFVMMAAERRSEMGMARAIGVQRTNLVQMFTAEGLVYDFIAAAVGVLLGLLVSYTMVGFIGGLFNDVVGQFSEYGGVFSFQFRVAPPLVVIAYCVGVLFTFVIVTLAAWRVSRLNIVSAIRDLPESTDRESRSRLARLVRIVSGPLLIGLGGVVIYNGLALGFSVVLAGTTLVLVGMGLFTTWVLERTPMRDEQIRRFVYSVVGLGLILIWGPSWTGLLGQTETAGELVQDGPWVLIRFAMTGPMLILGAILVVMFNADAITWAISRLLGGVGALTPVLKTAIAYPLSARFRTGTTMLLFAMVISTVAIMTVVIDATQTLVAPDSERQAGFEIQVSPSLLSFFNPVTNLEAAIATNPDFPAADVAVVGGLASSSVDARQADQSEWEGVQLVGANAGYLGQAEATYTFAQRAEGYGSDSEVWTALNTRDDVAVATQALLADERAGVHGNGPGSRRAERIEDEAERDEFERQFEQLFQIKGVSPDENLLPEIRVTLRPFNAEAEVEHDVQVIGIIAEGTTLAGDGLLVNGQTYANASGGAFEPSNFYLKLNEEADAREVAQAVERSFLASGLNASIMAESFAQGQALTRGILQLFQGFMALGLLVGIAALGVISSRTVVERRQQIGMLRAIGFQPRMVAVSFLLESSFIALTGMVIGVAAGVVLGQAMIQQFFDVLADGRAFAIPWAQLFLVVLLAYGLSLLATILPAYQAARIYPAEALRYE